MLTDEVIKNLVSLLAVLLGGGLAGHWIAGKKNTNDDKQEIINQLQEERLYFSEQLKIRDVKIDELYDKFRELEKNNNLIHQEKAQVQWELDKKIAENEVLKQEKEQLQNRISHLEQRVDDLEKENK